MQAAQQLRVAHLRVGVILLTLALLVFYTGVFTRIDNVVYDLGWRFTPHPAAKQVVIVAIDETSLAQYGRWPWARERDAQLINAVCRAQPLAIGVDIAFVETGNDANANQQLHTAIADCGKVTLPVMIEAVRAEGQILEFPPIPLLANAAAKLGRVGVVMDADGVTRAVNLWEGVGTPAWPLLAQQLLLQAQLLPANVATKPPVLSSASPYTLVSSDTRLLDFVGETGSIPRISASLVLANPAPLAALRDKIVLIGATAAGIGDFIATPATTLGAPMPGVEVLANTVVAMRDGRLQQVMPMAVAVCLTVLFAMLPLLWLPRLMPLSGLLVSVLWLLILVGISALLPYLTGYRYAPAGAIFAALSSYPLWSWYRLEVARRHLDKELSQLAQMSGQAHKRLSFEQRIEAVQSAQQQLQRLQVEREDMINFISHDIRVPLASAAQQLQSGQLDFDTRERLSHQLQRAHTLAQDYLNISRALNVEAISFMVLNLVEVLDQAIDSLYEMAQAHQVKLKREISDDAIWVMGDFGLLERAMMNLIKNAISYTPIQQVVIIGINKHDNQVQIWVQDMGAGIAPAVLPKLFQRFQAGTDSRAGSTGMGLYFVRTVIEKHGGSVRAENRPPQGARFTVQLKMHA